MWYDSYITPKELTKEYILVTIFSEKLKEPFEIRKERKKKIKLILVGEGIKDKNLVELKLKLIKFFSEVKKYHYHLEMDDPTFSSVEGDTDDAGLLIEKIPRNTKTGRLIVDGIKINLIIIDNDFEPVNTAIGALKRLANLGYCDFMPPLSSGSLHEINDENQLLEMIMRPLISFQYDHELEPNGELNQETIKELENIYVK